MQLLQFYLAAFGDLLCKEIKSEKTEEPLATVVKD